MCLTSYDVKWAVLCVFQVLDDGCLTVLTVSTRCLLVGYDLIAKLSLQLAHW